MGADVAIPKPNRCLHHPAEVVIVNCEKQFAKLIKLPLVTFETFNHPLYVYVHTKGFLLFHNQEKLTLIYFSYKTAKGGGCFA